jgi:hypothetical protein
VHVFNKIILPKTVLEVLMRNRFLSLAVLVIILGLTAQSLLAQPQLTTPRISPQAEISQTIGLSKITITFSRPGVKDRVIWGKLVPYGEVWRAGADENTAITFSDPVKVEGKELPAGKYGLHMIPSEKEWIIIFSKVNTGWGSYGYDEKDDALRISVLPLEAPFEERLSYRFDNLSENTARVTLYWEKLAIPFTVEFDVQKVVLDSMGKELRGLAQFYWQPWNQAANYCLRNNVNYQQALSWIDKSISINENYTNLQTKANLLEKTERAEEAKKLRDYSFTLATEYDLNLYGYQLLDEGNPGMYMTVWVRVMRSKVIIKRPLNITPGP